MRRLEVGTLNDQGFKISVIAIRCMHTVHIYSSCKKKRSCGLWAQHNVHKLNRPGPQLLRLHGLLGFIIWYSLGRYNIMHIGPCSFDAEPCKSKSKQEARLAASCCTELETFRRSAWCPTLSVRAHRADGVPVPLDSPPPPFFLGEGSISRKLKGSTTSIQSDLCNSSKENMQVTK